MPDNRPSVWKQIFGATLGAVIAVGGYTAYRGGSTAVRAYLFPPGYDSDMKLRTQGVDAANAEIVERKERLSAKADQAVERMREWRRQIALGEQVGPTHTSSAAAAAEASSAPPDIETPPAYDMVAIQQQWSDMEATPVDMLPGGDKALDSMRHDDVDGHAAAPMAASVTAAAAMPNKLPSSGPEMLLGLMGAFSGAVAARRQARKRHTPVH